ncbi:MAG: hypothetical protein AAFQ12_06605, partial [Pseudomonadota bacterium]
RYVVLPNEGMTFFLDQVEGSDDEDLVFRMSSGRSWFGCHKHLFKEECHAFVWQHHVSPSITLHRFDVDTKRVAAYIPSLKARQF